jgi:hypothetical protein
VVKSLAAPRLPFLGFCVLRVCQIAPACFVETHAGGKSGKEGIGADSAQTWCLRLLWNEQQKQSALLLRDHFGASPRRDCFMDPLRADELCEGKQFLPQNSLSQCAVQKQTCSCVVKNTLCCGQIC